MPMLRSYRKHSIEFPERTGWFLFGKVCLKPDRNVQAEVISSHFVLSFITHITKNQERRAQDH